MKKPKEVRKELMELMLISFVAFSNNNSSGQSDEHTAYFQDEKE